MFPDFFRSPFGVPYGIRTRVTSVKGRCPRPLDEGDVLRPTTYKESGPSESSFLSALPNFRRFSRGAAAIFYIVFSRFASGEADPAEFLLALFEPEEGFAHRVLALPPD